MIKNIVVSQKMHGETVEGMMTIRSEIISHIDQSVEVNIMNPISYPEGEVPEGAGRLWYLGRAIQRLDNCDLVIFANNYPTANGCMVEHSVVVLYEIPHVYECQLEGIMSWDRLMEISEVNNTRMSDFNSNKERTFPVDIIYGQVGLDDGQTRLSSLSGEIAEFR